MNKIKIGITIGDINGIGTEVIMKALADERILNQFTPIIYGSETILSFYKNKLNTPNFRFSVISQAQYSKENSINVFNCWNEKVVIDPGKPTENGGKFAAIALDRAVHDYKLNAIDAIVTAPINKNAMTMSGFNFVGHTEYFADHFKNSSSLMTMVSETMRVALVTNHIPIFTLEKIISKNLIENKLQVLNKTLIKDFNLTNPTIAVLGINPHAGDVGSIGDQDEKITRPVIIEAKKKGLKVKGPYPADGFFASGLYKKFDAILAMYHDQGLIPFKMLSQGDGINFTAGIPLVRTSPDHGTAYDIVGNNIANGASFRSAIYKAIDIVRNRKEYKIALENSI